MSDRFTNQFHLLDWDNLDSSREEKLTDGEKYARLIVWARQARGKDPAVFDALTEWILDDSEWTADKLAENEQVLMQGVLARFKEQNARLRVCLHELDSSGLVNAAVYPALDRFDSELSGKPYDEHLRETVSQVFKDFSAMGDRSIREVFAGNKTGPTGTYTVDLYGYVNVLKGCDAQVQWTLFMPDLVLRQQDGFQVDSFDYITLPAVRFIGREGDDLEDLDRRRELFALLDGLADHKSGFDHDILFMHHNGRGVDVSPWHGVWGRFMQADTPVPEGLTCFDFLPQSDGTSGPPYCSQFAYATFTGDTDAMHRREGYDSYAMYDVTRNIILGQGMAIPYPDKYWTAEVFPDGCDLPGSAYMFGVILVDGS